MKQLGVLDSAFVNLEHPNTPQHVGGLGIYDQSTAPDGKVRFKGVIANFEKRLRKQSIFRSRLVSVPGNLDRPYWVQDANFDPEFHIRHLALPQPGDWRQLCILVSRLHARPLDMSRPLWEAYIIEGVDTIPGVPKGAFAIYTKMHHSLVDGAGGSSIMSVIHDLEPDPKAVADGPDTITVDETPTALYLNTATVVNQVKNSAKLLVDTVGTVKELGKMGIGMMRKKIPVPPISSPKTRFNEPVGPYRVFESAEFKIDDLKFIKDVGGVKINDVVLAVVSGGMRRYLDHHNELPDDSLTAGVPLNMRTRRSATNDHNQVGSVFVTMHTDIADPMERLKAIFGSTQEAKIFGENSPLVDTLRLAGLFPPAVIQPLVRTYVNHGMTAHLPLGISSVVTNVMGPPFPLYCAGAELVRYYGIGLLTPGVGLFHAAFSMGGNFTLSVLADRDIMADPAFYRECIEASFAELLTAARDIDEAAKAQRIAKRGPEKQPAKDKATSAASKSHQAAKAGDTLSASKAKTASVDAEGDSDENVVPMQSRG